MGWTGGNRRARWQWKAYCHAHSRDLLLLIDDDLLGDPAQLLVFAESQFGNCHVDRALMMRLHRRDKVSIDVAGWRGLHGRHHAIHGSR
ncbi:hypothetical protein SAMN05518849_114104 [Sphingobium sp. AP50]|nr:hypothetical protein SAMN05518849_114104 [Sphingobium sp. AP50]